MVLQNNLTLIGMRYESKKCSSLAPPRSIFYKTQWAWQGVNFYLQKSLENFYQNLIQKGQGVESALPHAN